MMHSFEWFADLLFWPAVISACVLMALWAITDRGKDTT